ncbi:MAG: tetratricopeptide repeat protein [Candidatus Hermodarchaeota archaeon]
MAVYYFLVVECGPNEESSLIVYEYFKDKILTLSDGSKVPLMGSSIQDETNNWWVNILPERVSYGSPMGSNYRLVDYFTGEITRELYSLLKNAPPFRYALAGFEIEFFILFKELEECVEDGCYEGLILSKQVWKDFGRNQLFKQFSKNYMWHPFSELSNVGQECWFKKYELLDEYKINQYITLKLENGDSNIYVQDDMLIQCRYLLLSEMKSSNLKINQFNSIDVAEEYFKNSSESSTIISKEIEFWGHCSNIQAWAENNYNTKLLDKSIAFPILRKLHKIGDSDASKVFKKEIRKRIKSNFLPVVLYLIENAYLRIFSDSEIGIIVENIKQYIKSLSANLQKKWNKQISEAFRNSMYVRTPTEGRNDDLAIKLCEIALEFDIENNNAWYEMALSYQFKKDYIKAEKFYKKAIDVNPADTISIGNLCDVYLTQERNQDVIKLLENKLKKDILYARLWYILGRAYYNIGEKEKALEYVNISYEQYPHNQKVEKLRNEISEKLKF